MPGTSQAFHKYLLNKGKNKQGLCSNNLLNKNFPLQMLVWIKLITSPKYLCACAPNASPPSPKRLLIKSLPCCRQQSLEGQWAVSISPAHQNSWLQHSMVATWGCHRNHLMGRATLISEPTSHHPSIFHLSSSREEDSCLWSLKASSQIPISPLTTTVTSPSWALEVSGTVSLWGPMGTEQSI